jgi:hypothetical protein
MPPEHAGIFAEANLLSILFPGAHPTRRSFGLFAPLGASLLLAGCGPTGRPRSAGPSLGAPSIEAQNLEAETAAARARVGLILPLTQNGNPSTVGTAMRNAAELALAEMGGGETMSLIVKDDLSSLEGARQATQSALAEGAELIIGPLFAPNVREAGRIARSAGKPVIGLSTDTSVAGRGVYLLSFLIETYVDRVIDHALSRGKKSFAALAPENDYGNVAINEFVDLAARRGFRVRITERYAPGNAAAAVRAISEQAAQIDALFIPEQAENMAQIAGLLGANGLDGKRVQILGTGLWNDARVLSLPALQGAWFASPEVAGYNAFAGRYRARFASEPARIASLAYDAVSLAAALARTQGDRRFAEDVLTNASGFNGTDGIFRFRADGLNERGLSVLQIANGATNIASPAPKSFSAAS